MKHKELILCTVYVAIYVLYGYCITYLYIHTFLPITVSSLPNTYISMSFSKILQAWTNNAPLQHKNSKNNLHKDHHNLFVDNWNMHETIPQLYQIIKAQNIPFQPVKKSNQTCQSLGRPKVGPKHLLEQTSI